MTGWQGLRFILAWVGATVALAWVMQQIGGILL